MNNPRVFVPIFSRRFDLTAAEPFGDVVYLLNGEMPSALHLQETSETISESLVKMRYDENDWICLTGPTILVSLLLACVCVEYGQANVLVFDAAQEKYLPRNLVFTEEE